MDQHSNIPLLSGPEDGALDTIAHLLGLPRPADIPRPGEVANWRYDEWKDWGRPYGFVREDRSKHAYVLHHEKLKLLISVSSTPSDFRSGLAYGTEFRRQIMTELREAHALAGCALLENPALTDQELKAKLTDLEWRQVKSAEADKRRLSAAAEHEAEIRTALNEVLAGLNKHGYHNRAALIAVGMAEDDAERMVQVIKNDMVPKLPNIADILESLRDLLTALREQEVADAAEKERARVEREEAQRREDTRIDKSEVAYNTESSRSKSRLINAVKALADRVGQAQQAVRALTDLANNPLIPAYPKVRIAELVAEAARANERLASKTAECDILETAAAAQVRRIQELEHQLEAMRNDKQQTEELFLEAATAPEWRTSCIKMVERLTPMLASDNFLKLAQGVAEAREMLAAAKIAIDANTPPDPLRDYAAADQ